MTSRTERIVVSVAILILTVGAFVLAARSHLVGPDSFFYASMGASLTTGGFPSDFSGRPHHFYPPGLPFLIGLVSPFVKDPLLAGRLVTAAAFAFLFPVFWLAVRRWLDDGRAAFAAAVLLALNPQVLYYTGSSLTEVPFLLFLSLTALLLFSGWREPRARTFLLGGLSAGFSFLLRPEGLAYTLVLYLTVLLFGPRPRTGPSPRPVSLLLPLVLILFVVAYGSYLAIELGSFTISGKAGPVERVDLARNHIYFGEHPETGIALHDPGRQFLAAPRAWLAGFLVHLHDLYRQTPGRLFPFPLLVLFGSFLASLFAERRRPEFVLLLLVAGFAVVHPLAGHRYLARYAIPLLIPVAMAAGRGLSRLSEALPERRRGIAFAGLLFLFVLPTVILSRTQLRISLTEQHQYAERVADRLMEELEGRPVLSTIHYPVYRYYRKGGSGMRFYGNPDSIPDFLTRVREEGFAGVLIKSPALSEQQEAFFDRLSESGLVEKIDVGDEFILFRP